MVHYHIPQDELDAHPMMAMFRSKDFSLDLLFTSLKYGGDFLCSTSGWDSKHNVALKVIQLANQPVSRLCPPEFIIARDSPLAKKLEEHLSLPPAEVKGARYDPLSAAAPVYDSLAALLRTTNPPLPSESALSE